MRRSKCPNCGNELKLTHEQRSKIQKRVLADAQSRGVHIGRPSKIDQNRLRFFLFKNMKTINATAKAYDYAAFAYRGEFSNLNFPPVEGK